MFRLINNYSYFNGEHVEIENSNPIVSYNKENDRVTLKLADTSVTDSKKNSPKT